MESIDSRWDLGWRGLLVLGLGIALTLSVVVPSTAGATELWQGKWKIRVEGGAPGKMCLKQKGDYVEGKFQSEDTTKFGEIWGDLTRRQTEWDGQYKDEGTGDKGSFHASQGEEGTFAGTFKPRSDAEPPPKYTWGGTRTDFDGGYRECVRSIK